MAEIKGYRKNIEVDNQVVIYKIIISVHEIFTNVKLTIAEKNIFSYYCAFKTEQNIDEIIMKDKLVGSPQVLYNTKSSLKKKKLLISYNRKLKVCDNFNFDIINNSSFILSKITAKNILKHENLFETVNEYKIKDKVLKKLTEEDNVSIK